MTAVDTTIETTNTDDTAAQWIRPEVRTSLARGTATQVDVRAGAHTFTIDEPASLGGTDLGANPVEHLLAALGACQVITFQVWAQKLGLQVDSIGVGLAGDLDLRGFFGLADGVRPGVQEIDIEVRIGGPESDEAYAHLVRTVDEHCPVLDSLTGTVPVSSRFVRV